MFHKINVIATNTLLSFFFLLKKRHIDNIGRRGQRINKLRKTRMTLFELNEAYWRKLENAAKLPLQDTQLNCKLNNILTSEYDFFWVTKIWYSQLIKKTKKFVTCNLHSLQFNTWQDTPLVITCDVSNPLMVKTILCHHV